MLKYLRLRLLEFARSGSLFYKITKLIKIWNSKLEKLVSAKFQIYQENFKNDNPRFQFVSKSDSVLLSRRDCDRRCRDNPRLCAVEFCPLGPR